MSDGVALQRGPRGLLASHTPEQSKEREKELDPFHLEMLASQAHEEIWSCPEFSQVETFTAKVCTS